MNADLTDEYEILSPSGGVFPTAAKKDDNKNDNDTDKAIEAGEELSPGRKNLRKWLGKTFRVVISDGRVLVGFFNCTDKDANIVLSMCAEYLEEGKDARILGNVMIPGKHIVSVSVDMVKEEVGTTDDSPTLES